MFDDLTGNEQVKTLLRRTLAAGRVPGALLFTGEDGVGKKLFALELAKALNCRTPVEFEGCGHCPACERIAKFNYPQSSDSDDWKGIIWTDHPDVGMVVAPKRVILVEQMRAIEREANYRPYEGKARVFLIEDADKLNEASEKMNNNSFMEATAIQKQQLLTEIDAAAKKYSKEQPGTERPPHYFTLMKQLVLFGFFTSKPGVTQVLRYMPVPGKYEGCIDYKEGETSWA